ncbi:MAG: thioredoxin family protein [Burkholderiaceae bacterium]|nr:thioredoxin family protein [Burkholderiaceae bacterium]
MAVESNLDLPLGTTLPPFALPDTVSGRTVRPDDYADSRALLVTFICNHCPFVIHIRPGLVEFAREYQPLGLAVIAINSNDPETYPQDSPEQMRVEAKKWGFTFPYLFDQTQQIAKDYRAVCTPEFYLFDSTRHLVYRGRFDESRPNSGVPVTGAELRAAVDAVLANLPVPAKQIPSIGCSIKWRFDSAPARR